MSISFKQLKYLIKPITPETFYNSFFEKAHLLIQDRSPDYYNSLLNIVDLDNYFQRKNIDYASLKIGKDASFNSELRLPGSMDEETSKHHIFGALNKGESLVINGISREIPALRRFITKLSFELGITAWSNLYVTPANKQTFDQHYDTHDVFIMQIHGRKKWKLYDSHIELPHSSQKHNSRETNNRENATFSFYLEPGDLLYIPRGMIHEAIATDTVSIHITLGFSTITNIDLVRSIENILVQKLFFRKTVSRYIPYSEHDNINKEDQFKSILIEEIKNASYEDLLKSMEQELTNRRRTNFDNHFSNFVYEPNISSGTIVKLKDHKNYYLDMATPYIHLTYGDKTEDFPPFMFELLDDLITKTASAIGDLKSNLSQEARIKVVQKLVKLGIIDIVDN